MELVDVSAALASSAVTWERPEMDPQSLARPDCHQGLSSPAKMRDARSTKAPPPWWSPIMADASSTACRPSLRALPEVVAAVNGQAEVLMDGGVRRGTDIVKAVCLGARAVLCGRAYAYGLAAAGQAGVTRALEILRADVERTLRLLGCPSIAALDRSYVDVPASWE